MNGFSSHSDRDRVLEATDLVRLIGEHVSLKRQGREHVGLCPFHDDHSPSLHIVSHKGTPFYKCFACSASGTAIDFVMHYHRMAFIEALRFLAERSGIELTQPEQAKKRDDGAPGRSDLIDANRVAQQYYQAVLKHPEAGRAARDMIQSRGIAPEMVEHFGLGAAPDGWDALATYVRKRGLNYRAFREVGLFKDRSSGAGVRDTFVNRLVFPICDQLGRPIAFGGRVLRADDQPKYLNSPESSLFEKSKTLFGLHLAHRAIGESGMAIVTEGYTDVIAMHQAGITNAVATLGTALTREHARLLSRLCDCVTLLFDGDDAGQKAADRGVEIFFSEPIDVRICVLPGGVDPDDLLRSGPDGAAQLRALLDNAVDALTFLVRRFQRDLESATTLSGRQKQIERLLGRLADLGLGQMSGIRKRLILPTLARLLNVSIRDIEQAMPRGRRGPAAQPVETHTEPSAQSTAALSDSVLNGVSPARRRAEEDLLGILIFHPEARREQVDAGDGHLLPVAEAYLSDAFAHEPCRRVYEAVHAFLEDDRPFDVAALRGAFEELPALASYIGDLYFRGEAMCGGDESVAPDRFRDAARAFDAARDRASMRERLTALRERGPIVDAADSAAAERNLPAFVRILEERRTHGDDLAVLPRGLRG